MSSIETPCEISVIIPCRFEPLISETVRAVLDVCRAEDVHGIEVIIVGSGDWVSQGADPSVRVVAVDQPLWSGPARNRGLALARGETVVFLDADCLPLPEWLHGIRRSQGRGPVVCSGSIVTPMTDFWDDCYNVTCFREYLEGLPPAERGALPSFCLWGPRAAFVAIGGFDETWAGAEDLDLTARLGKAGLRLRFEPDVRVLHRPHARSFRRLVRHGWAHGGTSIRARRTHPEAFRAPGWSTAPVALVLLAPLVACYYLLRTYLDHPRYRAITARGSAAIFLHRLAWCLGAAWGQLHRDRTFEPVANT